jgi:hypothetical protein
MMINYFSLGTKVNDYSFLSCPETRVLCSVPVHADARTLLNVQDDIYLN